MPDTDEYVTTGVAAKVLGGNHKQVIRLADKGVVRSWNVPGSEHRRVNIEDVRRFSEEIGRRSREAVMASREGPVTFSPGKQKQALNLRLSEDAIRRLKVKAIELNTTASALVEQMVVQSIAAKEGASDVVDAPE